MTTAGHVAEVDDRKDDGLVDTPASSADCFHQRIPCAYVSFSLPPGAEDSFLQTK